MAVGAIAALIHDIVVTAGVYSLIGFEVTPSTVVGFLTILGFSLYDTVVVFDKVDENVRDLDKSRSEEHTSELQSRQYLVCRLLLEKKKYCFNSRSSSGLCNSQASMSDFH